MADETKRRTCYTCRFWKWHDGDELGAGLPPPADMPPDPTECRPGGA